MAGPLVVRNAALPGRPAASIAVAAGRIAAVGDLAGCRAAAGPGATEIDAGGGTVLPGFIDAHAHLLSLGEALDVLDLRGLPGPDEVVRATALRAADTPPGAWIKGRGWTPEGVQDNHLLSQAVPDRPVLLNRFDHHGALVNAEALRRAGIGPGTPDPPGGRILRGADGRPTGVLLETAADLVRARIPPHGAADRRRLMRSAAAHCLSLGLTGLHDAIDDLAWIDDIRSLLDDGEHLPRIFGMVRAPAEGDLTEFVGDVFTHHPDPRFELQRLRLVFDGGLGARGALFDEPYQDDPDSTGLQMMPEARLREAADAVLAHGRGLCVHAIGDRANRIVLDTLETALAGRDADHRFVIEHATVVGPSDVPRLARLGLIASVQPAHLHKAIGYLADRLGPERARHAYAFRTLLSAGVRLALGTDFPVAPPDPLGTLHAAETRQTLDGSPPGGLFPDQRLTRGETVHGATYEGAYMARREHDLGVVSPGHRADLVVFDRDLFALDAADLPAARLRYTVLDGQIVHAEP
ncbi:amidohydrolase [Actinomadura sp. KC06]|uniref:amidohydrolase n=1 Tax=Actinomadura sp. KC06 TaxID=2530369 RepID=UPI00104C74B3|nr:amidohydrolase [Actinomadura sp. KC06]TDD38710.1 amidohydrolase [Actinomadura sp. KC06]